VLVFSSSCSRRKRKSSVGPDTGRPLAGAVKGFLRRRRGKASVLAKSPMLVSSRRGGAASEDIQRQYGSQLHLADVEFAGFWCVVDCACAEYYGQLLLDGALEWGTRTRQSLYGSLAPSGAVGGGRILWRQLLTREGVLGRRFGRNRWAWVSTPHAGTRMLFDGGFSGKQRTVPHPREIVRRLWSSGLRWDVGA